ncbi:hypothetical protein P7C70_g2437, partial [Phenoliferia sp. Uapishka_3]
MLRPSLALCAAALVPIASALSVPDIESVFGKGTTGLSGNAVTLPEFVFTVVTNSTHALVSLNATTSAPGSVGWMGTGVGTAMANADFLVTWPNVATGVSTTTPWTLSHRNSPGEVMPVVASTASATETPAFFTFLPALSTSDAGSSFTVVSYIRLLSMPSGYPTTASANAITRGSMNFIYASSTVKPDNNAENAQLTQHDQSHAKTSLDLSIPITLSAATATGSSAAGASSTGGAAPAGIITKVPSRSTRDMYLIAHAVIGTLGLLLFTPAAILLSRFLRSSTWFPAHAALNGLAAVLVVIAFALGTSQAFINFKDTHTKVGLALLILILIQVVFGALAHRIHIVPNPNARFPTLSGKGPIRLGHIVMGLAILGLGFAQIHLGFDEYPLKSDGGQDVPHGVYIVFYIIIALVAASYLGGWVREFLGGNKPEAVSTGVEKVNSQ